MYSKNSTHLDHNESTRHATLTVLHPNKDQAQQTHVIYLHNLNTLVGTPAVTYRFCN